MKTNHAAAAPMVALVLSIATASLTTAHPPAFENAVFTLAVTDSGLVQTDARAPLADRMAAWQCPGVCVTLVEDGRIAWTRGHGVLAAGRRDGIDAHTVFQAGSVSKFVTAVIVMHHVERGLLDLDVDVNTYLTSWRMPENEWGEAVTLRQLLAHTSGIPGTNFDHDPDRDLPKLPQILDGREPARNAAAIPSVAPGGDWSYSNVGYVVIQLVLEDVFGRPLDTIAREVLFEPLGMTATTFIYPLPVQLQQHEAMPHAGGEEKPVAQDSRARAQGGLMTTTEDMARLVIEVMKVWRGESTMVMSRETARLMMTPQVEIPPDALGLPLSMGLGALLETASGSLSFLHPGHSAPGSTFIFVAFPETEQAVVIGANGNRGDVLELEILATLAEVHGLPAGQYFR